MTEFIENIFSSIFGNNVILATILIAFIPIIELKGAIPFSMSTQIWGTNALSYWSAFFCGFLGSTIIVPILALVYIPIINLLKKTKLFKKLGEKLEEKVNKKKIEVEARIEIKQEKEQLVDNTENIEQTKNKRKYNKSFFIKIISVFAFVATPLPFTGVWTGTCLAIALGLGFWWSCLIVIIGNLVAGLIITFISTLFGNASLIFFYIFIILILVLFLFFVIKHFVNKQKIKS